MLWKIYFWALIVLILLSIVVEGAFNPGLFTNTFDVLNMLFMLVGLVGVYGYAYKKNVGSKGLWLIVLIVTLLYQLSYSFALDQWYGAAPASSVAEGLVTFVPLIPMYIVLGLYVCKKKPLLL